MPYDLSTQLSPLFRSTIGFDSLARLLDHSLNEADSTYPPYNIAKTGEDHYAITMAVAGFTQDDITLTAQDNSLIVKGSPRAESEGVSYLHRGIAGRGFERRFQLAEHIRVEGASLEHGLLTVTLVKEVPEARKPRQIQINAN